MSGPTKRWNTAFDDREAVREAAGVDAETLDAVLDGLFRVVNSRVSTTLVGLAKFEWVPVAGRIPTGREFVSRRLRVTPSRYVDAPAKDTPVIGKVEMEA